jgi:hypothetical protein
MVAVRPGDQDACRRKFPQLILNGVQRKPSASHYFTHVALPNWTREEFLE